MEYKLSFTDTGECIEIVAKAKNDALSDNQEFEEIDPSIRIDLNDFHKEPYRNNLKLKRIQKKAKDLLFKYNYVFGLSTGWQKDEEYRAWCAEVISFSKSFEDQLIETKQITFPTDPWGNKEVLEL